MPEGDSVYRFAALVRRALEGRVIRSARSHGPGPVPRVELIVGARCVDVETRGKNLLIHFDNGLVLRGHLRMHGTWHIYRPGQPWRRPEHEARLVLDTDEAVVVNFKAPVIELLEERALGAHRPVAALGPDLLDDDFDEGLALANFRDGSRAALTIGDAILDQRAMAGVGNIWKNETLFRAGVNPWRRVGELDDDTLLGIIQMARGLLRASVGKENSLGLRHRPSLVVYLRGGQPCARCHTRLESAPQGNDIRLTAWCPKCQPVVEGQMPPPTRRL